MNLQICKDCKPYERDKMKILLVAFPRTHYARKYKGAIPLPVNLLYIASYLRKNGHIPHIIDFSTHNVPDDVPPVLYFSKFLKTTLQSAKFELIGLSCFYSQQFPWIREIAEELRKKYATPIAVGGLHPTLFAREILENCQAIDFIILNEEEVPMVELANSIESEHSKDLFNIPSIGYRIKNSVHINETNQNLFIEDLDQLGIPAWDLINVNDYYSDCSSFWNPKNHNIQVVIPILSSRGCPLSCSFCMSKSFVGKRIRFRSPKVTVDEIEMLMERYGATYFEFSDDNISIKKSHIIGICDEIIKRKLDIQFSLATGLHLPSANEEIFQKLAQAGCVTIALPIEHGNDYIRNEVIGKNLSRKHIIHVRDICKKYNFFTIGLYIIGFFEETKETLTESLMLMEELELDVNWVGNLVPFPGTPMFEPAKNAGLLNINTEEHELWEGVLPFNLSISYIKTPHLSEDEWKYFREKFASIKFNSKRAKKLNN
jgi:radical SAM superfamily enzyme YgiQ (UPF0313 family)